MKQKIAVASRDKSSFYVKALDESDPRIFTRMADVPEAKFYRKKSTWILPKTRRNLNFMLQAFPAEEVTADQLMQQLLQKTITAKIDHTQVRDEAKKYGFKTKPFAHQRTAFNLCLAHQAFALFMEMGTGKTKVVVDVVDKLLQDEAVDGHLVVCPASAIEEVWVENYLAHSTTAEGNAPACLIGSRQNRLAGLQQQYPVWVINYEGLASIEEELLQLLQRRKVVVTLDESSYVKTHSANRSKIAHALGKLAVRRYILTGTPMTQNYLDLYSQFRFLDPDILGFTTFTAFKNHHAIFGGYQGYEVVEWKNLEELKEQVAAHSFRVLKDDCLDLPPKLHEVCRVALSKQQNQAYEQLRDQFLFELEEEGQITRSTINVALTKILRLHQVTAGFVTMDDGSFTDFPNPKTDVLVELAREACVGNKRKVVVQCLFRHEMDLVEIALATAKISSAQLNGSVPIGKRRQLLQRFREDPDLSVMICQVQLAALGIDLTAANLVIRHTNTYSLQDTMQFEDRAHRIGQKKSVTYVDILATGTVDVTVQNALSRKLKMAATIVKQGKSGLATLLRGGKL